MIPFLGLAKLFSNPLTKYLGEKVIGHFEHKAEVLKNERIAVIEVPVAHCQTFGGGLHRIISDLERE